MPIVRKNKLVLSEKEKKQIEDDANFILATNGVTGPPVSISRIISNVIPNSKIYTIVMPERLKGAAFVGQGRCDIYINSKYPETSQRYSKAHELGHILRGESGPNFDLEKELSPMARFKERRADYFAASQLMPDWMVNQYWQFSSGFYPFGIGRTFVEIGRMASIFKISRQSMIIRLKWLNLIPCDIAEQLLLHY